MVRNREIWINCIVFLLSELFIVINNSYDGSLYRATPDGDLYISIAKNFIDNGHFIQTAREYEINFIVPPGLPFIYTMILATGLGLSGLVFIQYAVFGLMVVAFKKSIALITKHVLLKVCVLLVFVFYAQKYFNPCYLLTEVWTAFGLIMWVYFSLANNHNYNTKLLGIGGMLFLMRPVLFPFLLVPFVRGLTNYKKMIKWGDMIILFVLAFVVFVNGFINYRETGSIVMLENYSGIALYTANNPKSSVEPYSSVRFHEWSERDLYELESDKTITRGEKNTIYIKTSLEYIKGHPLKTIERTLEKMKIMFYEQFRIVCLLAIASLVLIGKDEREKIFPLISAFLIVFFITSLGLVIVRYAGIACICYIILMCIGVEKSIEKIKKSDVK